MSNPKATRRSRSKAPTRAPDGTFVQPMTFRGDDQFPRGAFELVFALSGITRTLDQLSIDVHGSHQEHETVNQLCTAAHLLMAQLEARIAFGELPDMVEPATADE